MKKITRAFLLSSTVGLFCFYACAPRTVAAGSDTEVKPNNDTAPISNIIPPDLIIDESTFDDLVDYAKGRTGDQLLRKNQLIKIKAGYLREIISGLADDEFVKIHIGSMRENANNLRRYQLRDPNAALEDIKKRTVLLFEKDNSLRKVYYDPVVICPPPHNSVCQ